MKRYLLDTGPLAGVLLGRRHVVDHLGERLDGDELATSVLAYGEIVEHIRGRQDFEARERELRDLLRDVCPYFLTYPILDRYYPPSIWQYMGLGHSSQGMARQGAYPRGVTLQPQ